MKEIALRVSGLTVAYGGHIVVRDISFTLDQGEVLALIGLSGCGKTTILRALLGLLPETAQVTGSMETPAGSVDLADKPRLRRNLGREIGFVAQNPFDACAPMRRLHDHIAESWRAHGLPPDPARIDTLCQMLGLPQDRLGDYPHEWSGGMLQRANIAAAGALDPAVLVADEPTSALDAARAQDVMAHLRRGARSLLIVSHDIALMAGADRVLLVQDGTIRATASGQALTTGTAPAPLRAFAALDQTPRLPEPKGPVVLAADKLVLGHGAKPLLRNLSFELRAGQVLGIAGPSGAGKTTLLAAIAGHLPPLAGRITRPMGKGAILPLFQDALSSMNPRWPIARIVAEPLGLIRPRLSRADMQAKAMAALADFGLGHLSPDCLPGQISTGQAQRVVLARASLARPALLLADEPTSALDPRQKAAALAGLARLAGKGAAILLVSHDRALLANFCHATLDLGSDQSAWGSTNVAPSCGNRLALIGQS
jgi:peptide/nickel transport system ATP-binding protein